MFVMVVFASFLCHFFGEMMEIVIMAELGCGMENHPARVCVCACLHNVCAHTIFKHKMHSNLLGSLAGSGLYGHFDSIKAFLCVDHYHHHNHL